MSGAELGLAIVATIDVCIKYGDRLVKLHSAFKHAESELVERLVRLESIWMRVHSQLDFLTNVCEILEESHRRIQNQSLHILKTKLGNALVKLEGLIKQTPDPSQPCVGSGLSGAESATSVKRWKYALFKESLDKAIGELEDWQRVFDPSWFLIMKAASPRIDSELAQIRDAQPAGPDALNAANSLRQVLRAEPQKDVKIFLPQNELHLAHTINVPYSTIRLARRSGSSKWLAIETIPFPVHGDLNIFLRDVRDLARRLHHIDPLTFSLMSSYGVVKNLTPDRRRLTSVQFISRVPKGLLEPRSLRQSLLAGTGRINSLSERFRLAKELARAVSYVHTLGFVHKSIRPETVLLFQADQAQDPSLGALFLAGLEDFRTAEGRTLRLSASSWERDLYRHPSRQGKTPQQDYIMQHDIYSLGVCLLEIGLYESFVRYSDECADPQMSPAQLLVRELPEYPDVRDPAEIKARLMSLTKTELPRLMGTRYAQIVEACLTCLDPGNLDFGDETEFYDKDGILVSVRYTEKILLQLNEIYL